VHSCAHALRLCFALNATLQLVALVATDVAVTAYARVHFVVGHHFLDSPEKVMCFSSWLFRKVPILRRRAELEAQVCNHRSGTLQVADTHVKRARLCLNWRWELFSPPSVLLDFEA